MPRENPDHASLPPAMQAFMEECTAPVVPLMTVAANKSSVFFATGFLVRSGRRHYLFTAAHVLHDSIGAEPPRPLFFMCAPGKVKFIEGSFRTTSTRQHRNTDRLDIGVARLLGEPLPPYDAAGISAASDTLLAPRRLPRQHDGWYYPIGVPASKAKADRWSGEAYAPRYIPLGPSAPMQIYRGLNRPPLDHIILKLDRKYRRDENLKMMQEFPHPRGMSGGPVWAREGSRRTQVLTPRIVGIITEYHDEEKMLIATDIDIGLRLMHALALDP